MPTVARPQSVTMGGTQLIGKHSRMGKKEKGGEEERGEKGKRDGGEGDEGKRGDVEWRRGAGEEGRKGGWKPGESLIVSLLPSFCLLTLLVIGLIC